MLVEKGTDKALAITQEQLRSETLKTKTDIS